MLRVTIELVPGGVGRPRTIGMMEIGNDLLRSLETDGRRGDYTVTLYGERDRLGEARVEDFPRLSASAWELAFRAIRAVRDARGGKL